jgi:GTPase
LSSVTANTLKTALEAIAHGDRRALARALTTVERRHCGTPKPPRRPACFGITGPPGAGKSTLINAILTELRKRDRKVGVLLVDPSHPTTGGALLGDRIRMNEHNCDPAVFIRSLGSRGSGAGISVDLEAMINVMAHFPFDLILIETVGVGQLDTAIAPLVDKVVMLSPPGSGDEIQAMKASNLDLADAIVINKADMPENEVRRHEKALEMRADFSAAAVVPLFKTVALTGEGVDILVEEFFLTTG